MAYEFDCSYQNATLTTTWSDYQDCECSTGCGGTEYEYTFNWGENRFCCTCDDSADGSDYIVGWELISLCATIAINLILGVVLWITCNLKTIEQNHGDDPISDPDMDSTGDGQGSSHEPMNRMNPNPQSSQNYLPVDVRNAEQGSGTIDTTLESTPLGTTQPTHTSSGPTKTSTLGFDRQSKMDDANVASGGDSGGLAHGDVAMDGEYGIPDFNTNNSNASLRGPTSTSGISSQHSNRNRDTPQITQLSSGAASSVLTGGSITGASANGVSQIPRIMALKKSQSKPAERTRRLRKQYTSAKDLSEYGLGAAKLASDTLDELQRSHLPAQFKRKTLALRFHADKTIKSRANLYGMMPSNASSSTNSYASGGGLYNNNGRLGANESARLKRNSSIFSNSSLLDRSNRFRSHKSDFPELMGQFQNVRQDKKTKRKSKFTTRKSRTQDDMFYNPFNDHANYMTDNEYGLVDNRSNLSGWDNREPTVTATTMTSKGSYTIIPGRNIDNEYYAVPTIAEEKVSSGGRPPRPKKQITRKWNVLDPKKIDSRDIDWGNASKIGHGSFGVVLKAKYHGSDVAVKKLHATKLNNEQEEEFRREAALMQRFGGHPRLIQFFGICRHEEQLCIVTEFMENGSLWDAIFGSNREKFKNILSIQMKLKMVGQAGEGVNHLHKEAVIHRDISARNFLIDSQFNIKIADLGMARLKSSNKLLRGNNGLNSESKWDDGSPDSNRGDKTDNKFGPIRWMAPECIYGDGLEYSEKTDSYAFGITLFEVFAEERPFDELKSLGEVALAIYNGQRPRIDNNFNIKAVGPRLAMLMKDCWQETPALRPQFDDIIKDLKDIEKQWVKRYRNNIEYREEIKQQIDSNDNPNVDRTRTKSVKESIAMWHKQSITAFSGRNKQQSKGQK